MSQPEYLLNARIAIVGLGLMGGSLALALRDHCQAIYAVDPDQDTLRRAQRRNFVDWGSADPAQVLPRADLVILATPVGQIIELAAQLPLLHPGAPVIIDIGSTKAAICDALECLPQRFEAIGGHPMCGKADAGLRYAEATLFEGAPFAFVPIRRTTLRARSMADQLALAIGAHPLWMGAAEHDRLAAETSHLPYLVSLALAQATSPGAAKLIGPGFRSTTRLARSSVTMMQDVLVTNRENVLIAMDQLQQSLAVIRDLLANRMDDLDTGMTDAYEWYLRLLGEKDERR